MKNWEQQNAQKKMWIREIYERVTRHFAPVDSSFASFVDFVVSIPEFRLTPQRV